MPESTLPRGSALRPAATEASYAADSRSRTGPRIVVFSSLFPSAVAPTAGLFIRERMFRVARLTPMVVVAPVRWSPFDALIRRFRPSFRLAGARYERVDGIAVHRPRYLSFPAVFKRLDGVLMARSGRATMRRLQREFAPTLIDAHFLYPDGYAASILARQFNLPLTVTIRGSKDQRLLGTSLEPLLRETVARADRVFAVSESLKRDVALRLGAAAERVVVIGNGIDLQRFSPIPRAQARERLGIGNDDRLLLGLGNLIPLKGFQRVIPLLPALRRRFPLLRYWIVGGGTTQGDLRPALAQLAREHGVEDMVRFCGRQYPDSLRYYYSAADVFVLATEYEGWANVFLEAMACGIPVVTTRVGGNAEVVPDGRCGLLVDFWDPEAFSAAVAKALEQPWDRQSIIDYAREHDWDARIETLFAHLQQYDDRSRLQRGERRPPRGAA